MRLVSGETEEVLRMAKNGLGAQDITRKLLASRSYGGFTETLLEVEAAIATRELTESEEANAKYLKNLGLDSLEVASKILERRHEAESYRIFAAVKGK
jgi:hypothetical protein